MWTKVVTGAAALVLLLAGVAALHRVTDSPTPRSPPGAASGEGPQAADAGAPGEASPPSSPGAWTLALPRGPDAEGRSDQFAPPPSAPTPSPTPRPAWLEGATRRLGPRPDPTPLGPLRPYVAAGMATLQRAVAECAQEAPQRAADAGARAKGRTTLTVHLEALENELRIIAVEPAGVAVADDWRVRCARRKLEGQLIRAPARAGARFAIPFELLLE